MKPVLVVKSSVQQQYLDYLEDMMYNTHPGFHSMRVQPANYKIPAEARELTTSENLNFKDSLANQGRDTRLPLSITEMGHTEPLRGRHVYPFSAFSMQPNLMSAGVEADLPRSYKVGRQNKIRDLQMYGFEGKENTPQRYANNAQTEGIIYGDVDESQIIPIMAKPFKFNDMRHAARSLQPSSGYTPADLPYKRQKMARELMDMSVPPLLMDEHIRPQNISDPVELDSYRDDTRQWSQNQQRLNIPTEDLLYASEPMEIAMRLLKDDGKQIRNNAPRYHTQFNDYNNDSLSDYWLNTAPFLEALPDHLNPNHPNYIQPVAHRIKPNIQSIPQMDDKSWRDSIEASEPMDIAMRLLKEQIDYENQMELAPHEQLWNDEADEQLVDTTNSLWDYVESMHPQDKLMMLNQMNNPMLAMGINTDPRNRADMTDEETEKYINDAIWEMMFDAWQDSQLEMPDGIDYDLGGNRKSGEPGDPVRAHAVHPSQWKKLASEPMNIAFQLLKERVSPEAKRHKLEYDKKYESSPERVKYREELNRERRRRGIYGSHDHKDISHTEGGKLTLEGEHENRARHFKDKGTLRQVNKAQQTLPSYDEKMVQSLTKPDQSTMYISSRPGRETVSAEEQSAKHDELLAAIAELNKNGQMNLLTGTGKGEWGNEHSIAIQNYPPEIKQQLYELARRYGQDAVAESNAREKGMRFVNPASGEDTFSFGGREIQENPRYSTDFPTGQKISFTE